MNLNPDRWKIVRVVHNEGHESEHPADECRGGSHWPCSSTRPSRGGDMRSEHDYRHHGSFNGGVEVGEFRVSSRVIQSNPGDSYPEYDREITITLTDMEQLEYIRVITPDGETHRLIN